MTQLDVLYRYGAQPNETTGRALARLREVYGIRNLQLDEHAHTIRLEYDATRLTDATVLNLLHRTGLEITERISLIPPQAPPPEPAAAPAA